MATNGQVSGPQQRRGLNRNATHLRALWYEALGDGAGTSEQDSVFDWLIAQYTGPGRAYHDLTHIERMFAVWKDGANTYITEDPQALALAIWFHDAIYDPARRDNEERSAEKAALRLSPMKLNDITLARIRNMILATAAHQATDTDRDTALLLDLDLAILGAETREYNQYARAIREEYRHIPKDAYRAGRTAVLRGFLNRSRIYLTDAMHLRYDEAARRNLAREIATLAEEG